jgi:hypothetical protein
MRALAPEVRFVFGNVSKSRTSAAEAVNRAGHYGTSEAVPIVSDVFPQDFSGVKPVL